ncbi:MAG: response regulator, partial [Desulfobulbaceae bacterium]|nr:response regulator [Desulfobulbaceae bacterium]
EEQNTTLIEDLNDEISQREILISQRTLELNEKNNDLMLEIKDRERTEERLQQANTNLDATLRAIPDLLFELDAKGTYLDLWAHDVELLIAQKSALIGQTVTEMLPADAAQVMMAAIHEAAKTGASHGQVVSLPLQHGVHWFELSTSRKQLTNDSSHFLMLARDITDKHQMEAELLKVRKLESVGVLAGGIAHDFNNILSAILGNIELAIYRVKKDEKAVLLLSDAQKAAKRAAKLTQQLLTFSRGGHPVKEATSLTVLISETADFVLHGSQVSCDYTFQDDLWMVDVDSGQISQVIQNIILNATHAMPEGGRINIRCDNVEDKASESLLITHEGNFVRITIRDTGVGIPQDVVDRIFDPYFTTKQEGSGLGLAICYSIIKKHDGHITVQSSPDKGTLFTLYLPAKHSSNFTVAKQQKLQPAVKTATVMVMDDEEMIREIVQKQLSILGHDAVLVADGEEAINKYQELQDSDTPVDLVIMDLTIPGGMGGREASKKLLQIAPETKIIVASGYSNDPLMANYSEYGFSAAVAKPFDLARLKKAIEESLA